MAQLDAQPKRSRCGDDRTPSFNFAACDGDVVPFTPPPASVPGRMGGIWMGSVWFGRITARPPAQTQQSSSPIGVGYIWVVRMGESSRVRDNMHSMHIRTPHRTARTLIHAPPPHAPKTKQRGGQQLPWAGLGSGRVKKLGRRVGRRGASDYYLFTVWGLFDRPPLLYALPTLAASAARSVCAVTGTMFWGGGLGLCLIRRLGCVYVAGWEWVRSIDSVE